MPDAAIDPRCRVRGPLRFFAGAPPTDRGGAGLGVLHDAHDATIVKTVLDIGRGLDPIAIAEGIETPEQEAALMRMGCRYAQGCRYGRPVPADVLGHRLAEPRPAEPLSRSA